MKIKVLSLGVAALLFSMLFVACKKDETDPVAGPATGSELAVHTSDEQFFSGENDALADDALAALNYEEAINGRVIAEICNASYDLDSSSNPRKITITYNGLTCDGRRTRTGVVTLSMPGNTRWKNAGAVLTVNVSNLRILRVADGKSVVLNGTQTYTNVSGGLSRNLASLQTIVHTIASSGMEITFDNGTKRTWQVARKRVFSYENGIVIKLSGTHTDGTSTMITEWGINRFGRSFTTATLQPIVIRQDCDFRVTEGQLEYVEPGIRADILFGLDIKGDSTACPGNGSYYGKLTWTVGNQSQSAIFPY